MPPDQPLYGASYIGCLTLKIWQFGDWNEVVIDDRLPTINGQYIYAHCEDPTEFWVAFVEKAFAKLYGSYENIEGGHAGAADNKQTAFMTTLEYQFLWDTLKPDGP